MFHKLKVIFLCRADKIKRRKGDVNANYTSNDDVFNPVDVVGLLYSHVFCAVLVDTSECYCIIL